MKVSPATDRAITRQLCRYACIMLGASGGLLLSSFAAFTIQQVLDRPYSPVSSIFAALAMACALFALALFVTWAVRVVRRVMRDRADSIARIERVMREGVRPGEDGRRYADTATVREHATVHKLDPSADPAWLRENGMDHAASLLEYMAEPREVLIPAGATAVVCPLCMKRGTDGALPDEHLEDPTPDENALLCPTSARRWRIIREGNK